METTSMTSHISESRIICPHCGVYEYSSVRFDCEPVQSDHFVPTDDFSMKCGNCKRIFRVERCVQITYKTSKTKKAAKTKGVIFSVSTENKTCKRKSSCGH